MNFYGIRICCLVVATISISLVQSGSIDPSAKIGDFTKFGENVTIEAHSHIGSFTKIGSHSVVKENSVIGQFADISDHCLVGKHTRLNNYVKVGAETSVGAASTIHHYAQIGKETSIATRVRIDGYAKIGDNNQIGMGCRLAQYCSTGANAKIDENAIMDQYAKFDGEYIGKRGYVGQYCIVGSNVNIGELAVLHKYVSLKPDTIVKPTEIVIRTPTSLILYELCTQDLTSEEIDRAKPTGQTISPEFNKLLRKGVAFSMNTLRQSCAREQSSGVRYSPPYLSKIISLYLIQYHGYDRFKEYAQQILGSSGYSFSTRDMLNKEYHFKPSTKNVLEPDVQEKFIQLLTIGLDASRTLRVDGDEFCAMFKQIENKQRNILLADSSSLSLFSSQSPSPAPSPSPSSKRSSSNRNIIHSMIVLIALLINLKIIF